MFPASPCGCDGVPMLSCTLSRDDVSPSVIFFLNSVFIYDLSKLNTCIYTSQYMFSNVLI